MSKKEIYVDHSATTYVKPEVLAEMLPYFSDKYGNASSIYTKGQESRTAIEKAREQVARAIGAEAREIFFTASASEANNWMIKGVVEAQAAKGNHIITSAIEHPAVLEVCKYMEKKGCQVTYLPVDENGFVNPEDVKQAITDKTILISIMFANNEIGTIQPIAQIGQIAKEAGVYFHTDAVQAVGNLEIDVKSMGIDALSLSAHKFYGPKGVGALYIKKGVKVANLIHGGHQERGKRAATENVPGVVGMGKAIEMAVSNMKANNEKLRTLRDKTIQTILETIPYVKLNGDREKRLPGHVNISFEFIEGESLLLMLNMHGIYGSSGSACTSGSLDPSHVLLAIGLSHEIAHGSLRISYGAVNTMEDVDKILEVLPGIVQRLRDMSPLYEAIQKQSK